MKNESSSDATFDAAAALEALSGRVTVLRDLAQLFLQERQGMVDAVRQALQADDPSEVERAVHSLRGVIGYFRARTLWSVTEQMQAEVIQARTDRVRQFLPELEQSVEDLAASLDRFLADSPPESDAE